MGFQKENKLWDNPKVKSTQFQKGEHPSVKTEFKKGHIPWAKGKKGIFVGESNPCWRGGLTKNPDYFRHKGNERRIKRIGNGGAHTMREWEYLKQKYNTLTRDHILPINLGGTDNIDNIQPLCRNCNSRKWATYINYIALIATS